MAIKKSGLGRNLSALLSQTTINKVPVASSEVSVIDNKFMANNKMLRHLPIDLIQRSPYQPRQEITSEALQELADSIRHQGIIQPIVVRTLSSNGYELIAGERRWRAAQLVGLAEIPAVVHDVSDEVALAWALIENIQRENLNAIEEAIALDRLHQEFSLTHQQIAEAVGKSRTAVTNLLRLLNLDDEVKHLLIQKQLEMGHARALLTLPAIKQRQLAQQIVRQHLSVREAEALANKSAQPQKANSIKEAAPFDPNIIRLQETIAEKLGAVVAIQHSRSGKGKLTIYYSSPDELEGVLANMGVENS